MVTTNFIYNFGQTVLDSSKTKAKKSVSVSDPEDLQVIESYEGECEKCKQTKPQKTCPMCGE